MFVRTDLCYSTSVAKGLGITSTGCFWKNSQLVTYIVAITKDIENRENTEKLNQW